MISQFDNHGQFVKNTPVKPAGFWWRCFAFIWDAILLAGLTWLLTYAVLSVFLQSSLQDLESLANLKALVLSYGSKLISSPQNVGAVVGAALVIPQLLKLLYLTLWEAITGATPGKLLMGLRVQRYGGGTLSLEDSARRNFFKTIAGVVPALTVAVLLPLIGVLPITILIAPFALIAAVVGTAVFSLIDYLHVPFDEDKQALHDEYSGSQVIQLGQTSNLQRQVMALASLFVLVPTTFFGAQGKNTSTTLKNGAVISWKTQARQAESSSTSYSAHRNTAVKTPAMQSPMKARYDFESYQRDRRQKLADELPRLPLPSPSKKIIETAPEPVAPISTLQIKDQEIQLHDQVALLSGSGSVIEIAFYENQLSNSDRKEVIREIDFWKHENNPPVVVVGLRFSPFSESCGMLALRKIFIKVKKSALSSKKSSTGYKSYSLNPATRATTESVELSCERGPRSPLAGSFRHILPVGDDSQALQLELDVNTILK